MKKFPMIELLTKTSGRLIPGLEGKKILPDGIHKRLILTSGACQEVMDASRGKRRGNVFQLGQPDYPYGQSLLSVIGKAPPKLVTFSLSQKATWKHLLFTEAGLVDDFYDFLWGMAFQYEGINVIAYRGTDSLPHEAMHCLSRALKDYVFGKTTYKLSELIENFMYEPGVGKPAQGAIQGLVKKISSHLDNLDPKAELMCAGYSAGTVLSMLTAILAKEKGFTNIKCLQFAPVPFCSLEAAIKIEEAFEVYNVYSDWDPISHYYGYRSFLDGALRALGGRGYSYLERAQPLLKELKELPVIGDPWLQSVSATTDAIQALFNDYDRFSPKRMQALKEEREKSQLVHPGFRVYSCLEDDYKDGLAAHGLPSYNRMLRISPKLVFEPRDKASTKIVKPGQ